MRATFQNSGMVLSIGIFFSLMILGLASSLPNTMKTQLVDHGIQVEDATKVADAPPVGSLFAAFLGYNPMRTLLGPKELAEASPAQQTEITGKRFFPALLSEPFLDGLRITFGCSAILFLLAAWASWMRGALPPGGAAEDQEVAESLEEAALT